MLVVRPAGPEDYDWMAELAALSGRGFTSLPEDEPTLRDRLAVSHDSFTGAVAPLEAWYTLMLEDSATGRVAGVAGVKAAVGLKRPFFSFRVVNMTQFSTAISTRFDHSALVLVNECSGWSEVGSLFLRPENRQGGAGRLLAQSRYMLIAADPQRFADVVLAELRGWFDEDGICPFWETIGARFFRLPFDQADLMSASTDGQFILDLAPRHPIYLELLPEAARTSVGRVHRDGEAARVMLEREGFRYQNLVDIFDAGPSVSCRRDDITTVRGSVVRRVKIGSPVEGPDRLVATDSIESFRAVRAPVQVGEEEAEVSSETAEALRLATGDPIRIAP
ncbi:MAG: arginine N-succinyltransferase [Caulobacteraceae bacterium]